MTPLISVVIPVYNRGAAFRRALESLNQQTYRAFEVIVCDDGSIEDIPAAIAASNVVAPLRYLRIPNSGGPARPRNRAVEVAQCEWIALLDSDDCWDANRLEIISSELQGNVDLIYHRLRVKHASADTVKAEKRSHIGEALQVHPLRHLALWGNPIPNSSVVVRKQTLLNVGGFCESPPTIEDFDAWLRIAEAGGQFKFLNSVLGTYWVGGDGISTFNQAQIDLLDALFLRHVQCFDDAYRQQAWACHNYRIGAMYLQLGENLPAAHRHLIQARSLPTASLRAKRFVKLCQLLWRGAVMS